MTPKGWLLLNMVGWGLYGAYLGLDALLGGKGGLAGMRREGGVPMRMPGQGAHLSAVIEPVLVAVGQVEIVKVSGRLVFLGQLCQYPVELSPARLLEERLTL